MQCSYKNAKGTVVDLATWPLMIQDPEALYKVIRKYAVGAGKITKIYSDTQEFTFNVSVFADSPTDYASTMEALQACVESDLNACTPGYLSVNGSYIRCYCVTREVSDWQECDGTADIRLTVAAAVPDWIRDLSVVMPLTGAPDTPTVGQIYDFPLTGGETDYQQDIGAVKHAVNASVVACDFTLFVFGPAVNPTVTVAGHPYGVTVTLADGEYLEIDSEAGTVVAVTVNGTQLNKFNYRDKENSVFEPIPAGDIDIIKNGQYAAELIIHQKGMVPKWISL